MIKFIIRIINQFKEYFLLTILIVISLTVLSSNEKPQIKKLRTFALGSFAVVNQVVNSVTSIFEADKSVEQLKRENAELMLQVNRLRKNGYLNEELRSMLAFRDTSSYPLVYADVVSKLVNKIHGNFIINKGGKDGIKIGMPAVNDKGIIGVIGDVTEDFSVVRTLYNSGLNVAVTVQSINIDGILSWNGNELIIKNIPTTYNVRVGDRIETSDFSSILPPHIPVGVVSKRETISLGLLHTISIKPFADISAVDNLFIIKSIPSKQVNQLEMNLMK